MAKPLVRPTPSDAKAWLKGYRREVLMRLMYSEDLSCEDLSVLLAEFGAHWIEEVERNA